MKKIFHVFKLALSSALILVILSTIYFLFFCSKETRYLLAESIQGTYLSQTMFDILIFQNPKYSNAYFEKSVAFNKRGDYAAGFELLNKAVDIHPESHLGYRGWLKLHKLKDYKGAISDFERLDSLTPNVIDAPWGENIYYLKGISYKALSEYEMAILEFDKSLESEKDSAWVDPNLFLYKGITLNKLGRFEKAIKNFDACLTYSSNTSPEAYFQKAIAFKHLNQIDSSIKYLHKSKIILEEGRKLRDSYNEIQDELYLADIKKEITNLNEQNEGS